MKSHHKSLIIILTSLIVSSSCSNIPTGKIDEEKEKEAIMKVIQAETNCFFKRDYKCWQEQFTHSDYSYLCWFEYRTGSRTISRNNQQSPCIFSGYACICRCCGNG